MYKQITIQTLHNQGKKNSQIARDLGCHRNTIRQILQRNEIIEKQTRVKSSVFDKCKDQIKQWKDEKVTKLRIHEKLREEYGIHSTYVNLCIYMNKHFPTPIEAFGVQLPNPGEEAELDFGYLGMLPGVNGKLVKTWGIAIILGYSRVGYFAICYDQKLDTLCSEIKQAFVYFGGVPLKLKIDNMKAAILKNQHYDLEFNPVFLEFAMHYNTVIIPCTPYSPEQKGKVESGIKYLQNNFVNGRTFTDDQDIAAKLKDWMTNYANQRTHGTTRKVPWTELLETERPTLQQLPVEEFSLYQRSVRKVGLNCHIHFENNYYSVPSQYIKKEVTVKWNDSIVQIIHNGEQIALHTKSTGLGEYITVRTHMPIYKMYSEAEHQSKFEIKMQDIGDNTYEYFRMLLKTKQSYWFQTVRVIMGLCEKYGKEAVELSLKRALYYNVTDITTIKNILEKKLYLVGIEPKLIKTADEATDEEDKLREKNQFCRDLNYYTL